MARSEVLNGALLIVLVLRLSLLDEVLLLFLRPGGRPLCQLFLLAVLLDVGGFTGLGPGAWSAPPVSSSESF